MSRSQTQGSVGPMNVVGRNVPRIDAFERVTGRATYTRDVRVPGMLYARVLRSPHPHARIRSVDASGAEALPGVRVVITHETHPIS
jgi:CO/xanthine dehydrogenase Mo-binding subunit